MNFTEDKEKTAGQKQDYIDSLRRLIEKRQSDAENVRNEYLDGIFENPGKYREDLKKMLGWPLVGHETKGLPEVTCEKIHDDEEGFSVYRMSFEILEGVKLYGLLFKAGEEKKPLVLVQHGGGGSPEFIAAAYRDNGHTNDQKYPCTGNYNDMLQRVLKHGVHAFAPQLLLWNQEDYNIDYNRQEVDARLKRVGSSITAVEIYGLSRILDYFETKDYVSEFGMVGLSYGGFYTLFTTALDTRIKSAVSCAFFNSRDYVGWPDWVWQNSSEKFDDADVACLVYPRRICLEVADNDHLFNYKHGEESFEKLKSRAKSKNIDTDWVSLVVFEGVHEFCKFDEPIERLINDIK